ncbi:4-amino-4-deoxychorismate lyase [Oceanospirillum multiglobuliferum]|uniref:Aminodeoxychorismate lyase n=1 Tax=Oceanospirillum multiglobuliferum TaxID=64969 RepID=A0A1T4R3E5_9GAMM|nr:aminodeoxychorismate lyase [Oceanospirillum multiglobuliferum]OPX55255.1 aminodeoxychorismate lyase [Oceanospirillum multiglobuliferum]SKA10574.1 4-amino-4-deoxychorismate lyase [Oceanospirillum multiglobuliferum]
MTFSTLINGQVQSQLSITDRGLAYGDGLFETCRLIDGVAPLLSLHWQRLCAGCIRLKLPNPFHSCADFAQKLSQVVPHNGGGLAKLILTRGSGGRGYLAPSDPVVSWILQGFPVPETPLEHYHQGVVVRRCALQLSVQPILAGLKHLNRLEQVLARAEWQDDGIFDGLLFDQNQRLIESTVCNIFVIKKDQLLTPLLDQSGVAGVMRAAIIESSSALALDIKETNITENQLLNADAAFLCNSVRGIIPIRAWHLDSGDIIKQWPIHPLQKKISQHWHPILNLPACQ